MFYSTVASVCVKWLLNRLKMLQGFQVCKTGGQRQRAACQSEPVIGTTDSLCALFPLMSHFQDKLHSLTFKHLIFT